MIRVIGIGLNARASREALAEVLGRLGQADRLATVDDRARRLSLLAGGRPESFAALRPAALRGVATLTQSARVMALYGTGSVAEACALVAAGQAARLTVSRIISADGTVTGALAEGEGP